MKAAPGQRTLHATLGTKQQQQPSAPPTAPAPAPLQPMHFPQSAPTAALTSHATIAAAHTNLPYDPAELAVAQEIAAKMRSECDVLKGPPKSSKDDPNFVESYYRASRLHFIGRWKARLEALMASSIANVAPTPAPFVLGGRRTIMHLDMDCFFASVAEAGHPEFIGKPLAVCHSNSERGSGEVSSANYEARKSGVRASMFIARAKELCPGLIVVPYEFEKYEKVSEQVYRIFLKYTSAVQPISCDEAFLDITGLGDPETIASAIRKDIVDATGCTASAGIGPNMLLARIATKKAKPNGQFLLTAAAALPFLAELKVEELPGVGWSTERKLAEAGLTTVGDLQATSKSKLQKELGNNAGSVLWDFAHARDNRKVEPPKPRQSVGAEVNWGIRFVTAEDPEIFLKNLAVEVAGRMKQAGIRGKTITLKLKRKKPGWTEPIKFLGCGACDSFSKSVTLASGTATAEDLYRESVTLLRMLRVPFDEIRGIGITVTRLDSDNSTASALAGHVETNKIAQQPVSSSLQSSDNIASDENIAVDHAAAPSIPVFAPPIVGQVNATNTAAAQISSPRERAVLPMKIIPEHAPQPTPQPPPADAVQVIEGRKATTSEDSDAGWEIGSDPEQDQFMPPMKQLRKNTDKTHLPLLPAKRRGDVAFAATEAETRDGDTTTKAADTTSTIRDADGDIYADALEGKKGGIETKRKSPGSKKQVAINAFMPPPALPENYHSRHSMDGLLGDDEVEGLHSGRKSVRQELMAKYEGSSLTQIDAAELAALPWQIQKELIGKLPRTRQGITNTNTIDTTTAS